MTTPQLILVASLLGAVLFFAAGAALAMLRQRSVGSPGAYTDDTAQTRVRRVPPLSSDSELARLRQALESAQSTVHSQAAIIDEQNRLLERDATSDRAAVARDMQALRDRADRAEAIAREIKRARDEQAERSRGDTERRRAETARQRADSERLRSEGEQLRSEGEQLRAETERLRGDVDRLHKEAGAAAATIHELRRVAEARAGQLERSRTDAVAAATDLAQVQAKLRDVERLLAGKIASARDLSTENEQLKGRLRDAEALRSEYVRLRTATTDSEYLKSEIARLEQELRVVRVDALGARGGPPRPRPARGTDRPPTSAERTVGESLSRVIERFADAGTRSSVLGDTMGFPLATSGADGVPLAAYAAHLFESAARAKEYLPVSAPSAIEIIDTNGVRVSVWALEVEGDRLMLANLAVSPVDAKRVETTLGDLGQILAPSHARSSRVRVELP